MGQKGTAHLSRGIRAQMTTVIALIVLITVALISLLGNIFINKEFERYARDQQRIRTEDIVANLSHQHNSSNDEWNTDYIHGVGMYALYEGYVIRLYGAGGEVVWDAENHDMSLCGQVMTEITNRMDEARPTLNGSFVSKEYELSHGGRVVGKVEITSYGPYFFTDNDFRFLHALNLILLAIGALALILSIVAGWILARRIARPIVKTAHIATQISEGNYGIRFEGRAKARELDELADAMNQMAASLEGQEDLRKRLTTDVAHELRTPLTAVASHIEMMVEGVWEPSSERLKSCYEEIGRISGLVAELENLAQVESDDLDLERAPVDLLELARTASGNFESESAKKNISLEVDGVATVVFADKARLHRVIGNLLSNAIKYTREGGHVRTYVRDTPESGILTVEDDGIGIPAEELPLIFERFYRTDKSRDRKTGGSGIGLTIAKSIITAHGGKLEAESQEGRGSQFKITLPK
jgi:signal transduction histidine kinase